MSIFKHDCKKHGHRFEPRYSEVDSPCIKELLGNVTKIGEYALREILKSSKLETYECDICKYCGVTISSLDREEKRKRLVKEAIDKTFEENDVALRNLAKVKKIIITDKEREEYRTSCQKEYVINAIEGE